METVTRAIISNSFRKDILRDWEIVNSSIAMPESSTDEFIAAVRKYANQSYVEHATDKDSLVELLDDLWRHAIDMFCMSKMLSANGVISSEDADEIHLHLLGIFGMAKGYADKEK